MPNHSEKELNKLLNQIYGDNLINNKLVAFTFQYITSDLEIEIDKYKEPYIKKLTNDNVINLTGQSGSVNHIMQKKILVVRNIKL